MANVTWWHQTITWNNVDSSLAMFCGIFPITILQDISVIKYLKSHIFKLKPYPPGANELKFKSRGSIITDITPSWS